MERHLVDRHRQRGTGRIAVAVALVFTVATGNLASAARLPTPPPASPAFPPSESLTGPPPHCGRATGRFVPTTVDIPGAASAISVLALHRDANGAPGTPPVTDAGQQQMAFDLDSGILPGDPRGNALLNAHAGPNGGALGNILLAELHEGDRIAIHGSPGTLCYQVTSRVEVEPTDRRAARRYFAKSGSPQLAILTCSGERLGPGRWTKRTLWFASPMA